MTHSDEVTTVRQLVKEGRYAEALEHGRNELRLERDSSELLVLMANAALLGDGSNTSFEEIQAWLERARATDPKNIETILDLAHFFDSVVDQAEMATSNFGIAANLALQYLKEAIIGLQSVGGLSASVQQGIRRDLKAILDSELVS